MEEEKCVRGLASSPSEEHNQISQVPLRLEANANCRPSGEKVALSLLREDSPFVRALARMGKGDLINASTRRNIGIDDGPVRRRDGWLNRPVSEARDLLQLMPAGYLDRPQCIGATVIGREYNSFAIAHPGKPTDVAFEIGDTLFVSGMVDRGKVDIRGREALEARKSKPFTVGRNGGREIPVCINGTS